MSTRDFNGRTVTDSSDVDVNQRAYARYNRTELPRYKTVDRDALTECMDGEIIWNLDNVRPEICTPTGWKGVQLID